jgi:hypothetical protein
VLANLLALSPAEFEHAVDRLLPYLGCDDLRLTGKAGALGADIVCTDEHTSGEHGVHFNTYCRRACQNAMRGTVLFGNEPDWFLLGPNGVPPGTPSGLHHKLRTGERGERIQTREAVDRRVVDSGV